MRHRGLRDISISTFGQPKRWAWFWFLVMAAITSLTGCVATGPVKPSQAVQAPAVQAPAAAQAISVERLSDGRDGFIITEHSEMDRDARSDFQLAVAMLNEGNNARAVALLEKVIQRAPGVTAPYIDLALAYERLDKLEKAEAQLKIALQLVPDHPLACNAYGLLCRKAGRFDEARATYEKALARFPDYYPAHRNLGILCDLYLDDTACAMQHYQIYSEANPEDKKVKMWIADLQNRTK